MNTFDFTSPITAEQLNENMFKKFGTRIDLASYAREELENYRNLLRTKIHNTESGAHFNELLSNESYQRDKHMLNILNTKIKEMIGEGAKVDRQAAHITKSMMKKGKSKEDAEAIAWAHIKHPKKKKKAEEGIEETTMKTTEGKKKGDGNLANNAKPSDKVTRGDVIAGRLGKQEKGGKVKESESRAPTKTTGERDVPLPSGAKVKSRTYQGWQSQKADKEGKFKKTDEALKGGQKKLDKNKNGHLDATDFDMLRKGKKKTTEGHYKLHVRLVNESLKYLILEDEEGKAKAITAASDMVNDFTTWMTRIGQYQTKSMIELADAIRAEFGQAESDAFKNAVAPALSQTLDVLTQQREAISHAVAVLAGEATDVAPMGTEPGAEMPGAADVDSMNPPPEMGGDEFGASDAAAGGAETAGRGMRDVPESRQEKKFRRIAESHSIIARLAK